MYNVFISGASVFLAALLFSAFAQAQDAGGEVEEVVVSAEYIPDEKLATAEVADLLDAEAMSIAGDSDLGGALKRVPGLSLVGGKFIYVRGLGERYSATYFNGTPMPSPEPLQRAVPLDLFDTSITKNVLVQKTHSANYGLEFSGGAVDIRSAAVPDESFFKVKLSTGYNDISTSKTGLTSNGGSRDWLGVDDGGRDLPGPIARNLDLYPNIFVNNGAIASPEQDIARLSFTNNDWEARGSSNPYDYGLSLGGGMRFQLGERWSVGFITVGSLSNRWRNRFTETTEYNVQNAFDNTDVLKANIRQIRNDALYRQAISDSTGSTFDLSNLGIAEINDEERTQRTIRSNTLLSVGAVLDQQHFFNLTNLIARKTTDTIALEARTNVNPDERFTRNTSIDWIENEINFKQLSGEHIMDSANVKWRYAITDATRDNLDAKSVTLESDVFGDPFDLETQGTEPTRSFAFLDDRSTDMGIDIELPFTSDRKFFTDVKMIFGASKSEQDREFQGLQFNYILRNFVDTQSDPLLALPVSQLLDSSNCSVGVDPSPPATVNDACFLAQNFDGDSLLFPQDGTITIDDGSASNDDDFYSGTARFEAQYIMFDMQLLDQLRFNLGVRRERSLLEVRGQDGDLLQGAIGLRPPQIRETRQLKSFSVTWDVYPNMLLRAAYSETVNRPILRELAPIRLFNPDDGRFYRGNSALETAEIENFDLRYEMYFGENDYFSVSAFRKRIETPIEQFATEGTEEIIDFTWQNSDLAINEGLEFEIRKYITPILYVTSNATFIDSDVTDNEDTARRLEQSGITERSLTGVSEELYNVQVVYDDGFFQGALSYNRYSERVDSLITGAATTALVVEQPFASLDANLKLKIPFGDGKINVGFKVSNLLDENIERLVENLDNLPFETYDVGQTYGLSLEWKQ